MNNLTLIPNISINPSSICFFNEVHWDPQKPQKYDIETGEVLKTNKAEHLQDYDRKAHGEVSANARKKMFKAIDYLLLMSETKTEVERLYNRKVVFRIAFITLTLQSTQVHTDAEIINKLLNQMLVELRKYYSVKNYIWRAEKQKNGNLHFHILIDKFVPWDQLRNRWNRICNKLGYIDRFHKKNPGKTANSTDIHATKKIKDLKNYVGKYLSKNEGNAEQTGRIWGCNHELSNIKGCRLTVDNEISDELRKVIENSNCRKYEDTYFSVYYVDVLKLNEYGSDLLFRYFAEYMLTEFEYSLNYKAAM